jgi:hypothetical protein
MGPLHCGGWASRPIYTPDSAISRFLRTVRPSMFRPFAVGVMRHDSSSMNPTPVAFLSRHFFPALRSKNVCELMSCRIDLAAKPLRPARSPVCCTLGFREPCCTSECSLDRTWLTARQPMRASHPGAKRTMGFGQAQSVHTVAVKMPGKCLCKRFLSMVYPSPSSFQPHARRTNSPQRPISAASNRGSSKTYNIPTSNLLP